MFKELTYLNPFFESPSKELGVREFARLAKMNPATASKILKNFAKKGILKEKKERIYILYKANLESSLYKDLKVFYNKRKIIDSNLLDELNKFYLKPTILFFGSGAKGLDDENSDFDLLIISEKTAEFPNIKNFEKKLNRKLQFFAVKDIKNIKNKNLLNNMVNGIILQGDIKWI